MFFNLESVSLYSKTDSKNQKELLLFWGKVFLYHFQIHVWALKSFSVVFQKSLISQKFPSNCQELIEGISKKLSTLKFRKS